MGDKRSVVRERVLGKRAISADDAAALMHAAFPHGVIDRNDAEQLLEIGCCVDAAAPEWDAFYTDAIVNYVGREAEPDGIVSRETALWLITKITLNGKLRRFSDLDAIIRIVEMAVSSPMMLQVFALRQVRDAIVNGHGAARHCRPGIVGQVTADDVNLVRRTLLANESRYPRPIARDEADILFDINERSQEADNHPDWADLFVKAVANCIMAGCGYVVPPRQVVFYQLPSIADFRGYDSPIGQMASKLSAVCAAYGRSDACGDMTDTPETRWLAERIGRDGRILENERLLLALLRGGDVVLPASLQTLVDTAA